MTDEVVDLEKERMRRDTDELRAELTNLQHRLNEAIANLQSQIYDKVNA